MIIEDQLDQLYGGKHGRKLDGLQAIKKQKRAGGDVLPESQDSVPDGDRREMSDG